MTFPDPIALSTCRLGAESGHLRDAPRPPAQRDERYAAQFDWDTLFYDVYRVGRHVVLQGPPLFNLLPLLREDRAMARAFRWPFARAQHVGRDKRGEVWWHSEADRIALDGPLGTFDIAVQPNLSRLFAGRRVLHTLSKNNAVRWIVDWIAFYVAVHGADAVLLYDNGSTIYTAEELQAQLRAAFPRLVIHVIDWSFPYGPQGGMAGAVDGIESPWDSDFCQTGSLQHARLRFLLDARSVLNVDIDEMVLSSQGRSIFAATEQSRDGFIKFPGSWISTATPSAVTPIAVTPVDCRHGDFTFIDRQEPETCPPKWCIVPALRHARQHSWSVHNLFGAKQNKVLSDEFRYRHMKGISNSWKYDRWGDDAFDPQRFHEDPDLRTAFEASGLIRAPTDALSSPANAMATPAASW